MADLRRLSPSWLHTCSCSHDIGAHARGHALLHAVCLHERGRHRQSVAGSNRPAPRCVDCATGRWNADLRNEPICAIGRKQQACAAAAAVDSRDAPRYVLCSAEDKDTGLAIKSSPAFTCCLRKESPLVISELLCRRAGGGTPAARTPAATSKGGASVARPPGCC